MNRFLLSVSLALGLAGCAAQSSAPDSKAADASPSASAMVADDPVVPVHQLLILAPQGRPLNLKERAGLIQIEQTFADKLADETRVVGWQPIIVVDADPAHTPEEKLAIHASANKTTRVVVLTLDTVHDVSGMNLDMRAECVHLKFVRRASDGRSAVHTESVEKHSYRLYNEHTGDSPSGFSHMAAELVQALNGESWF